MAQLGGTATSSNVGTSSSTNTTKNSQGLGSSIVGGLMAGASLFNPLVTGSQALAGGLAPNAFGGLFSNALTPNGDFQNASWLAPRGTLPWN